MLAAIDRCSIPTRRGSLTQAICLYPSGKNRVCRSQAEQLSLEQVSSPSPPGRGLPRPRPSERSLTSKVAEKQPPLQAPPGPPRRLLRRLQLRSYKSVLSSSLMSPNLNRKAKASRRVLACRLFQSRSTPQASPQLLTPHFYSAG